MTLPSILLYIVFILAAIVLVVVVLLQEGRGGGFGEALGSHGRETFGVGSKGINTFTGWTAAVFLGSALLLHFLNRTHGSRSVLDSLPGPAVESAPVVPGSTVPPAAGGTAPVEAPPAGGNGGGQ
jgi:preprotein translocase subunit SecG